MGDDLKPCPWCGAAAEFIHGNARRYARCSNAEVNDGACGVGYRAEADWNRRPIEGTLRARAEAAEAEAERLRAELAAMPRPEDRCHGAWPCEASTALASAEAEAARWEARAEALAAALVQARADALWLAVLWNGTNRNRILSHMADDAVRQLHGSEQTVLTELWDRFEATNDDVVALLRRALGGRDEAEELVGAEMGGGAA